MHTRRGLDRLTAFSDGVVAIAITLLVLPLVDIPGESSGASFGQMVREHPSQFGAFVLSFVVIARLWLIHHRLFEGIAMYDRVLLDLTIGWLFTVVLLPFPTELVGSSGQTKQTSVLYIGTLLVNSTTLAGTWTWVAKHPELQEPGAFDNDTPAAHWSTPILFLVALLLSATVAGVGMWSLLLLLLSGPFEALLRRVVPGW